VTIRDVVLAVAGAVAFCGAVAAAPAGLGPAPALDALIEQFGAGAPAARGRVSLDAWVEADRERGGREIVVVLRPHGATRLVADPGITVTPERQPGLTFAGPLPHRRVDPAREYFDPPAAVRLPFTGGADDQPIRILVEYAWCVVDFQCYLGEATLTVANRVE
jgi:hypothetical protein